MDFGGYEEPISRAFWGSEDLDEGSTEAPAFTLEWLTDSPIYIKTLAVVAGNLVTGIIERSIARNIDRICIVNSTAEFNIADLYKFNDDLYVCTVNPLVDITSAGRFIDTISGIIAKSESIIAFTDENISRLHGSELDNAGGISTLWRSLSTKNARKHQLTTVPSLNHPSFVTGVTAGVMGYAEIMDLPATLYILYVTDDAYDTESIEPLMKLFTQVTNTSLPKLILSSKTFHSNKLKLYI